MGIFSWLDLLWKVSIGGSGSGHGQSNVVGFCVYIDCGLGGYTYKLRIKNSP